MTIYLEVIVRLAVAAVLGSLIGLERERLDRGAGLRTHALVATASALIIIVSAYGFSDVIAPGRIMLDPSRIAAQVVSGIGFLGAGTIILRKNAIHGLTTAASVWAVAGIGLAAGAGLYIAAAATTAILLGILLALKPVEGRIFPHKRNWRITLRAETHPGQVMAIEERVNALHLELRRIELLPDKANGVTTFRLDIRGGESSTLATLAEVLQHIPGTRAVTYRGQSAVPAEQAGESRAAT
jgi:putative Mg2+ transporter-C (MgtC) family protein